MSWSGDQIGQKKELYESTRFVKACRLMGCRIYCHPIQAGSKIIGINEQSGYYAYMLVHAPICFQTGIPSLLSASDAELETIEMDKLDWSIAYRGQVIDFIRQFGNTVIVEDDYAIPSYWPRLVSTICRYIPRAPKETDITTSVYTAKQAAMIELCYRKSPARYLVMRCKQVARLHGQEDENSPTETMQVAVADERPSHRSHRL